VGAYLTTGNEGARLGRGEPICVVKFASSHCRLNNRRFLVVHSRPRELLTKLGQHVAIIK
jgi:hypothetical protein